MKLATILTDARKALTAVAGAGGEALTLGLLHGTAERWTTFAVGAATAVLVYVVPNGHIDIPGLIAELRADIAKLQKRPVDVQIVANDPGRNAALDAVAKAATEAATPPADAPAPVVEPAAPVTPPAPPAPPAA
jgi:hypothetical protein